MTTTTLFLMYEIAQNNKIRNSRRYDTSNHFASENKRIFMGGKQKDIHDTGNITSYNYNYDENVVLTIIV
jgi:hypothetical protein